MAMTSKLSSVTIAAAATAYLRALRGGADSDADAPVLVAGHGGRAG